MAAARVLAGYSLGQADLLRRAMGKKKPEEMAKQKETFVLGCAKTNEIPRSQAVRIFDLLEKFAGYGFNKSHSAAYAVLSCQTAYLKANYPTEYMASLLSHELDNTDKIALFTAEAQNMGIEIRPPSVNESENKFTVEPNRILFRFGGDQECGGGLCGGDSGGEKGGWENCFDRGLLFAGGLQGDEQEGGGELDPVWGVR